jgi:hypothetical protein
LFSFTGWISLFFGFLIADISANVLASFLTAYRTLWRYFLRLPVVFAILHISYGAGFFIGLIKFWNLWGKKSGKHQ